MGVHITLPLANRFMNSSSLHRHLSPESGIHSARSDEASIRGGVDCVACGSNWKDEVVSGD